MKHLQILVSSIALGLVVGGVWTLLEYGFGLGPVPVWYATGIAAGAVYWACQYDRS